MRFRRAKPIPPAQDASAGAAPAPASADASAASAPGDGPDRPAPEASPATGADAVVVVPPLEERVDGLRAWLGQLDRKLSVRTYALGAAVVLALAAGIVGVVLAVSAKDESATKEELRMLRGEVQGVGEEAAAAAEDDVASLTTRLEELEARVTTLGSDQRTTEGELSVVQDDIADLRTQISDLETGPRPSGTGGASSGP